jgi:hypothetical protein
MHKRIASLRRLTAILSVVVLSSLLPAAAAAQTVSIGTANFLEWDVPASANSAAGALEVVSTGGSARDVFYVTKQPTPAPRLIRLANPSAGPTTWQSWALYTLPSTIDTGGLKMRPGEGGSGQLVFIRDAASIHRLTTNSNVNNHTRWVDTGFGSTSDLALDVLPVGGSADIYTTSPAAGGTLQRLNGGSGAVRRWTVGGGAGSVYLSGVAVRRTTSPARVLVYWSEPTSNMIGELNPATNAIRRWSLATTGASGPRQLDFDAAGNAWVVTTSGHVVRLNPSNNDITPYTIPTPGSSPFGVGPDGFIGFTENATKKVGMLIPDGTVLNVSPATTSITPSNTTLGSTTISKPPTGGTVTPIAGTGPATSTGTAATGIFVEATLPLLSAAPNAIEDDTTQPTPPSGAFARAFFYSVSMPSTNRVGRVELVRPAPVPTTVVLDPLAAPNPVDTEHCVTATVRDQYEQPMEDINVEFRVTGSVTTGGNADTDADGEAEFCYTGPAFPGADAIHAWADWNPDNDMQDLLAVPSEPSGDATKEWTFPVSTPGCEVKITNGGWIIADNGDRASFGGNAKVDADGNVSGNEEYQDHGPAQPFNAHGDVMIVTCSFGDQTQATIFGNASVDGQGSHLYRIDVQDLGEPGRGTDTYRFRLEATPFPYDSGEQLLEGGNVQIHQSN